MIWTMIEKQALFYKSIRLISLSKLWQKEAFKLQIEFKLIVSFKRMGKSILSKLIDWMNWRENKTKVVFLRISSLFWMNNQWLKILVFRERLI